MCIRDSDNKERAHFGTELSFFDRFFIRSGYKYNYSDQDFTCLLYTSDAADERSSVDLGGRRIIKKQTNRVTSSDGFSQIKKSNKDNLEDG